MARRNPNIPLNDAEEGQVIEGSNLRTFVAADPWEGIDNDADIDEAFISMQSAFQKAQVPGTIRVYKVPVDELGNALPKAQAQIHLASYAIDQYTYDELISVIKARFMKPGESMTIRVCASRPTQRGFVINRMITLQRESEDKPPEAALGQLGDVLKLMQESNQRTSEMMERIMTPRGDNPIAPLSKRDGVETAIALMGALTPLLTPVIAGLLNRPKPPSDLGTMIDAVVKLRAIAGGESTGGDSDDNSTMGLIKALGPSALQAFTEIAKRQPVAQYPAPPQRVAISAPKPTAAVAPIEPVPTGPAPASASVETIPQNNESLQDKGNPVLKMIKEQLGELITLAESNVSPVESAKLAAKLIPAQYDEQLLSLIETPDAFKSVLALDARTAAHGVWLETWRVAMLAEFSEPEATG